MLVKHSVSQAIDIPHLRNGDFSNLIENFVVALENLNMQNHLNCLQLLN